MDSINNYRNKRLPRNISICKFVEHQQHTQRAVSQQSVSLYTLSERRTLVTHCTMSKWRTQVRHATAERHKRTCRVPSLVRPCLPCVEPRAAVPTVCRASCGRAYRVQSLVWPCLPCAVCPCAARGARDAAEPVQQWAVVRGRGSSAGTRSCSTRRCSAATPAVSTGTPSGQILI